MHVPTYRSWGKMKQRCLNPNHHKYGIYGARGIKVHEPWLLYANFLADMGERPAGLTLDRIDVDGHYEPGNCRWTTRSVQQINRRGSGASKYRGVARVSGQSNWRAYITVGGKRQHLGVSSTEEGAFKLRLSKEKEYGIS